MAREGAPQKELTIKNLLGAAFSFYFTGIKTMFQFSNVYALTGRYFGNIFSYTYPLPTIPQFHFRIHKKITLFGDT